MRFENIQDYQKIFVIEWVSVVRSPSTWHPPFGGAFLFEKPKPGNTKECNDPVLPGNLFAFLIGAATVRYGHFIDHGPQSGNFGRELRLKTETVRFQVNLIEYMTPKDLVSYLHIGEVQVVQYIGKQGQEFITNIVPKKLHPVGSPQKPGAINNVGPSIQ